VLELAAERAGWGVSLPAGSGRGIALLHAFGSYVAQVADVTVSKQGDVRVRRVVCAVDCGTVVNPDIVKAQMESGIVFGSPGRCGVRSPSRTAASSSTTLTTTGCYA